MVKRRQKIDHKEGDRRLATFRIEHGQWVGFLGLCKANETTAGEVLSGFISECIASQSIPSHKGILATGNDALEAMISEMIDAKMADIQESINENITRALLEATAKDGPVTIVSGKKKKPITAKEIQDGAKIMSLINAGHTQAAIAEKMGITGGRVSQIKKDYLAWKEDNHALDTTTSAPS